MREIEADGTPETLCAASDRGQIEALAAQVLHTGQHDCGERTGLALDQLTDVIGANDIFAGARPDLEQSGRRIETVMADLRCDRITIR